MRLTADEAWDFWINTLGNPRYVLAPMVNASELQFRLLTSRYGTNAYYTPMLHSRLMTEDKEYRLKFDPHDITLPPCPVKGSDGRFQTSDEPSPYSIKNTIAQFCGNDAQTVVEACRLVEDHVAAVDLNCGCPQGIARRGGYGSYLLSQPDTIISVVSAMVENLKCPVTVKIRIADDIPLPGEECGVPVADRSKAGGLAIMKDDVDLTEYPKTLSLIKRLEGLGVAAICLHGRTRENKGHSIKGADWSLIRAAVKAVKIPVIANGSICSKEDANLCLEYTGAAAVMSAEGLIEDPSMFNSSGRQDVDELMLELCYIYRTVPPYKDFIMPLKAHIFHALHPGLQRHTDLRDSLVAAKTVSEIEDVVLKMSEARGSEPHKLGWYFRHASKALHDDKASSPHKKCRLE